MYLFSSLSDAHQNMSQNTKTSIENKRFTEKRKNAVTISVFSGGNIAPGANVNLEGLQIGKTVICGNVATDKTANEKKAFKTALKKLRTISDNIEWQHGEKPGFNIKNLAAEVRLVLNCMYDDAYQ